MEIHTCSLSKGQVYDIEGVVLDYLPDPPQSTTNGDELRYHYLFSYKNEPNILFLTQKDIVKHIDAQLPPTISFSDNNSELTWDNLARANLDTIKMDINQAREIIMPEIAPLGYKSILKFGYKIRIPKAVLGFTGGRPGITSNSVPLFIRLN